MGCFKWFGKLVKLLFEILFEKYVYITLSENEQREGKERRNGRKERKDSPQTRLTFSTKKKGLLSGQSRYFQWTRSEQAFGARTTQEQKIF